MSDQQADIVVVGAGMAGVSAVRQIVGLGQGRQVVLINGEQRLPYKRTRLSKHVHCGFETDQFALEAAAWYEQAGVSLVPARVEKTCPDSRSLRLVDGTRISWGKLVLATGAIPVWPAFASPNLPGVHLFREARETEHLIADLEGTETIVETGTNQKEMCHE